MYLQLQIFYIFSELCDLACVCLTRFAFEILSPTALFTDQPTCEKHSNKFATVFCFLKIICYNIFSDKFSVFSKISGIQTGSKVSVWQNYFCQLILLFSLFLLLLMDFAVPFDIIHGSHCTISANFYIYLQYFQ